MILKSPSFSSLWSKIQNAGFYEVFFLSGLAGFILGAFFFPVWQHAVEGAQVVSGLVRYPSDNIFYFYQAKIWTSLHQIFAIFLRLGFSERVLSIFLSGIMGMTSYQALALVAYVFSRNFTLAVFAPFFVHVTGSATISSSYPVYLMGMMATYGTLSFMLLVLVAALLAEGKYRIGGFLLGLLPSVHPGVGLLGWIVILPYFIQSYFNRSDSKQNTNARLFFNFFIWGLFISLLSLGVHYAWTYPGSETFPVEHSKEVYSLIHALGCHRDPVSIFDHALWINLFLGVLAFLELGFFAKGMELPKKTFLGFVCCAAFLSIISVFISNIPVEHLPEILIQLMPQRLLNFNSFIFAVMLFGSIDYYARKHARFRWGLTGALILIWLASRKHDQSRVVFTLLSIFCVYLIFRMRMALISKLAPSHSNQLRAARPELFLVMILFFLYHGIHLASEWPKRIQTLDDPQKDAVLTLLRDKGEIMATSPDLERMQLVTRSPVLLDLGALDMLPYVPEVGEKMFAILREVYGIRLTTDINPKASKIDFYYPNAQKYWETRQTAEWQLLARRYRFSELLTPPEWNLKLRRLAVSPKYALFEIPDQA